MATIQTKSKRKKRRELVPGAIIRIAGISGGPLRIQEAYYAPPKRLGLSVVDDNGCDIAISTEDIDRFEYDLLPQTTPLGLCGDCQMAIEDHSRRQGDEPSRGR